MVRVWWNILKLQNTNVQFVHLNKILRFYRLKSRELPDSIKEIDEQLEYLLRPYGVMRRTVVLKDKWYVNAAGPMLARKKSDKSVVALIPGKGNGYWFTDTELGKTVKVTAENAKKLDDDALCFYKPFPQRTLDEKELAKYVIRTIPKKDIISLRTKRIHQEELCQPYLASLR